MLEIKGHLNAKGVRLGIAVSRFNELVTKELLAGAIETYKRLGGDEADLVVVWVPGALELPLAAKKLAERPDIHAVVAVGAVIRGATYHFEVVANQSAAGLMKAQLDTGTPIVNAVLTTNTLEEALERAGSKAGNKAADAVMAAVEMVRALGEL